MHPFCPCFPGVLVLSLVACGNDRAQSGDASNAASTGQTGESTSGSSKTDGDYPVIRINETAFYGEPPANGERIQEALNVILREKAHAEIEFVYVQMSNLSTQLNLLLTGGDDSLDLLSGFWYAGVSELVSNGQVRAIDDLLASSGQGIQEIFEEYPEILHCGRINGKQYGIPSVCAWTCENCYLVMEDIVKEANIEFPEKIANLDELTPLLLKLKEANPDKYFIAGSTSPYWFPKTIDYLGDNNYLGVILDPANSTKIENYYESEYFLNFLENVKIWKANDLISPDPMSNNTAVLGNLQNKVTYGVTGYDYNLKNTIYEAEKQNSYDGPIVGTQIGREVSDHCQCQHIHVVCYFLLQRARGGNARSECALHRPGGCQYSHEWSGRRDLCQRREWTAGVSRGRYQSSGSGLVCHVQCGSSQRLPLPHLELFQTRTPMNC